MIVRLVCTGSTGADLPADMLERSGNTLFSRFNVTVGAEYDVWAMALWTYGLGVLIVDDTGRPNWKPIALFVVGDGQVPTNWEFAAVAQRDPVVALWGYPTLVRDPNHHDNLIERKLSALDAFLRESGAAGDHRLRAP
jgi:hypothetical protein